MILDLPDELFLSIVEYLDSQKDLNAFSQTNVRLQRLLNPLLYRRNAQRHAGSALAWASRLGHSATTRKAIQGGACVNMETAHYGFPCRPLHLSTKLGFKMITSMLLAEEAIDPNPLDHYGNTPLHYAVREADCDIIKLLLMSKKLDINKSDLFGMSPLIRASCMGLADVATLLLAAPGVDVNYCDKFGRTALIYASMAGSEPIVKLLLGFGGLNVHAEDCQGLNSLAHAAAEGHHSLTALLSKAMVMRGRPNS
ncbi:hypothetical protein QQS21_000173 [Conoideocrella luteorostrata]|uniref:F-box domain-containing protein n=1 Tax=Conoideocrella luteorostrata TaxID=1105319 RepID=A0AAJ0D171_9HYPO|nr:hypothetical protein QQS21_000173 [Conoideocrella luteorostrata]